MSDGTRELAMFPLGSVLFPGMPLPLRVFEPRYVAMLSSVIGESEREFGVVLIERGSEVGGGDVRFGVGTVARIASVEITEGSIVLLATGAARFEVVRWLADDPFPRAQVRELDELARPGNGRTHQSLGRGERGDGGRVELQPAELAHLRTRERVIGQPAHHLAPCGT